MSTSIHHGGSPNLMEAEDQVVPCYRIFSKTGDQIFLVFVHSGFWLVVLENTCGVCHLLCRKQTPCWLQGQLVEPISRVFLSPSAGILNHLLKEQLMNCGLSALRTALAQPVVHRGWAIAHTVVTVLQSCCLVCHFHRAQYWQAGKAGAEQGKGRQSSARHSPWREQPKHQRCHFYSE